MLTYWVNPNITFNLEKMPLPHPSYLSSQVYYHLVSCTMKLAANLNVERTPVHTYIFHYNTCIMVAHHSDGYTRNATMLEIAPGLRMVGNGGYLPNWRISRSTKTYLNALLRMYGFPGRFHNKEYLLHYNGVMVEASTIIRSEQPEGMVVP